MDDSIAVYVYSGFPGRYVCVCFCSADTQQGFGREVRPDLPQVGDSQSIHFLVGVFKKCNTEEGFQRILMCGAKGVSAAPAGKSSCSWREVSFFWLGGVSLVA